MGRLPSHGTFALVVASFAAGFLVAAGLMVIDELITLLRYCPGCRYQIPMLGAWDAYDAEGFAWMLILAGFGLLIVAARIGDGSSNSKRISDGLPS